MHMTDLLQLFVYMQKCGVCIMCIFHNALLYLVFVFSVVYMKLFTCDGDPAVSQDVDRRSRRNQDVKGSLMQKCEYVRSEISISIVGVSKFGHDILNAGNALLRG